MKVQAIRPGYYGEKLRGEGDVFELKSKEDFSKSWMKKTTLDPNSVKVNQVARVQQAPDHRDIANVIDDALGDESVAANGGVNAIVSTGAQGVSDIEDGSEEEASEAPKKAKKKSADKDVI